MLSQELVRGMGALYLENYDGSSESLFRADLADKHEVVVVHCDGHLVGFTTLKTYDSNWQGRPIRVVYSGDTIVSPKHWGQHTLAFTWIARIGQIKRRAPELPLYWFLLVKGHRTFKYLSVFSKSFFPHWTLDRSDLRSVAEHLARTKFGRDYDPATGVVSFPQSRGRLSPDLAEIAPEEMAKPSTQFFLARNPGYREGNELVCICELEASNLRPLPERIFSDKRRAVSA